MDPFQIKYGKVATAALSVASLISEIMWVTGTLIGLGKNVSVGGCDACDPRALTMTVEQLFWQVWCEIPPPADQRNHLSEETQSCAPP